MGADVPKQELMLNGKEIYRISAERFAAFRCVDALLVVAPADRVAEYRAALADIPKVVEVVAGGRERHESVWNALEALRNDPPAVVLVHDVVRPFVSRAVVEGVTHTAFERGAAVAAARAVDTLYEVRDGVVASVPDRALMWHAQTPQGFRYDLLRKAHERFREEGGAATDDVRLVIAAGSPVYAVESSLENFKITVPADLTMAEAVYRRMETV